MKLTQEEKSSRIARSCGLKGGSIPDYFNSLDAIHEAETIMSMEQCAVFEQLLQVAEALPYPAGLNVWHSTADQRAEALGIALKLWEEGK